MKSSTVPLLLATLLFFPPPGSGHAQEISLRILVREDDVAPGSGFDLGFPDGVFEAVPPNVSPDSQFSPPVAAAGGYFAFKGAVRLWDANKVNQGLYTGVWGGIPGRLSTVSRQLRNAPGGGEFTQHGQINITELGEVGFWATTTAGSPNGGVWWGDPVAGTFAPLDLAQRMDIAPTALAGLRLLQTTNHIGYVFGTTNLSMNTLSQELRPISYPGMPAGAFGAGVTLSGAGTILGMDELGRLMLQGNASNGTNYVFLADGPDNIIPVMAQGQPAPDVEGGRVGFMTASANDRGSVAILTRLLDDDANPFNDRSALFAGPAGNVQLVALSSPGTIWGGGTFISRSNHVFGADVATGGIGLYRLPDMPGEEVSFAPIPPLPYEALAGTAAASINALGQYAVIYGDSDLWLFNPGTGWTNVARRGTTITASGQSIAVNTVGFVGNFSFGLSPGGGGYPTGLSDDGTLAFVVNGTQIIATAEDPPAGFTFTGAIDNNWHTTGQSPTAPSNWNSIEGTPRKQPPGDAEPGTANVVIPSDFSVLLDQRSASIGSLASHGDLTLHQLLVLNRPSTLNNFEAAPAGGGTVLSVHGYTVATNSVWRGGTLALSNTVYWSMRRFEAMSGMITNLGNAAFQNFGLFAKSGAGNLGVYAPFQAFEPVDHAGRWGIDVTQGTLSLLGGGSFNGVQTNNVDFAAKLELAGEVAVADQLRFEGFGTLSLGSTETDLILEVAAPSDTVTFSVAGETAHLNGGELRGNGRFVNEGGFVWEKGILNSGFVEENGAVVGGFLNSGELQIAVSDQSRVLRNAVVNRGRAFHEGAIEMIGGTIVQDSDQAVWEMRGAEVTDLTGTSLFSNRRGHVLVMGNSKMHSFYEGRSESQMNVVDRLTLFGGADWEKDTLLLGEIGELRLTSDTADKRSYALRQGLDSPDASLNLSNAVLRASPGSGNAIIPRLTMEQGAQLLVLDPSGASIEGSAVQLKSVLWKGGSIGQPNDRAVVIPVELTIDGSDPKVLDTTLYPAGVVHQKAPFVINEGGVRIDFGLAKDITWFVEKAAGMSGPGPFVNNAVFRVHPDEPGNVEIAVSFRNLGEFICGAPEMPLPGTVVRLTGPVFERPAPGNVLAGGSWEVFHGCTLDFTGEEIREIGRGTVVKLHGGTIPQLRPRMNGGALRITSVASSLLTDEFSNFGQSRVTITDDAQFTVEGNVENSGRIDLFTGAIMTIKGRLRQYETGELVIRPFCSLIVENGGYLQGFVSGAGRIVGDVEIRGVLNPGASPGAFDLIGNMTLTEDAVLSLELAGTQSGEFDRVLVTGTALLDGTLAINVLDGFLPARADSFTVVQSGTLTGVFQNAASGQRVPTIDGFGSFQLNYTPTAVVLSDFEANLNPSPSLPASLFEPEFILSDTLRISASGTPGRAYIVDSSTDLGTWLPLATNTVQFDGLFRVEVPLSSEPYRFFRARAK